jgi:hypothetical protein
MEFRSREMLDRSWKQHPYFVSLSPPLAPSARQLSSYFCIHYSFLSGKVVLDVFERDIFPEPSFRRSGRDVLSTHDFVTTVTKPIAGSQKM